MPENLSRKITIAVVLVIASLACLLLPKQPFRLGLDLQGGTRLVYRFDFDRALREGKISQTEFGSKAEMLESFVGIIRDRVDPNGVMEMVTRPEGDDRVVIEIPGAAELSGTPTIGKLAADVTESDLSIALESNVETIKAFPPSGGVVLVDGERINYTRRVGNTLTVGERGRGFESTTRKSHAAGTAVDLLTNDDLQRRIENVGDMQFLLGANTEDFSRFGTDLQRERQRVDTWIDAHPNEPIERFNNLPTDQGGPPELLRWYPHRLADDQPDTTPLKERVVPLVIPPEEWRFSGDDLEAVGPTADDVGYPAVSFEIATAKKNAFGDFTSAHIDDGLAIVLNGEIATLATIQDKLPGSGIINGGATGFTQKEVKDLIAILRSGSLRIRPELLDKARVGASLGDDYVATSFVSALVALGVVVLFMVGIYRRLGVYSIVGLLTNMLLLLGALSFLRATLTLPGVAGIVLTVGMAVDGNILIFERLREELARGLKLMQAAKAAFERAAVTIIDSNLTTLLAGVILYLAGTGPIRGFATTLNIGILSTLFTVIVVTQILIFLDVKRGVTTYKMVELIKDKGIDFMRFAKPAAILSTLVIVTTCGLFIALPNREKLGIDFLGGFTVTARTQEPQRVEKIRELVGAIPGTIGKSAEVKPILESGTKEGGYSTFRVTYKLEGDADAPVEAGGQGESGEKEIQDALESVLQKGPVELAAVPGETSQALTGELYFESAHPVADLAAALSELGLTNVVVDPMPGRATNYTFKAEAPKDRPATELAARIQARFEGHKDSNDLVFSLASPLPESALVGAQVGAELRDKAILAICFGLLSTILYLRVRFAEYTYGIAVVVSLLHDVLVTLGALAVGTYTGLVQAEVDLSMIAAFLTIIGYSQNDTIVIFDRVREILPRSKKPLRDILNDAMNQCLGRTILTSSTVFLTIVVLFLFNVGTRNVLEGFSFAMLAGVISGTYSTVYIAAPVFLWLEKREAKKGSKSVLAAKAMQEEEVAVS
ncbi:MAG: protein translocase subunit SecD [Planctomycetota bacterium]